MIKPLLSLLQLIETEAYITVMTPIGNFYNAHY